MQNLLPISPAPTSTNAARSVGAAARRVSADTPDAGSFETALERSRLTLAEALPATPGAAAEPRARLSQEPQADNGLAGLPEELLAQALLAMAPAGAAAIMTDTDVQAGAAPGFTDNGNAGLALPTAAAPTANAALLLPAALAQAADTVHADGMAAPASPFRPSAQGANAALTQPSPTIPSTILSADAAPVRMPLSDVAEAGGAMPAVLPAKLATPQAATGHPATSATPAALTSLASHETSPLAQPAAAPAPEAFTLSAAAVPQIPAPATSTAAAASAPASAAYALHAEVGSREWAPALGQQLVRMDAAGHHVAELSLHPADLGPLRVTLTVHEGQAQAQFVAVHASVRQAIEAALPQLRITLADNGISLGQTSVNAESHQSASQNGAFGQNPPRQGTGTSGIASVADAPETAAAARPPAAPLRRLDNRAVDTFA